MCRPKNLPLWSGSLVFLTTLAATTVARHTCDTCTAWSVSHSIAQSPSKWVFFAGGLATAIPTSLMWLSLVPRQSTRLDAAWLLVGHASMVGLLMLAVYDVDTHRWTHDVCAHVFFGGMVVHMALTLWRVGGPWTTTQCTRTFILGMSLCILGAIVMTQDQSSMFGKYEWAFMSMTSIYLTLFRNDYMRHPYLCLSEIKPVP